MLGDERWFSVKRAACAPVCSQPRNASSYPRRSLDFSRVSSSFAEPLPPVPPTDLISRVTKQFTSDNRDAARRAFHLGAVEHVQQFKVAAQTVGAPLEAARRLLDFGCGPGRLMRLLGELAAGGTELHGVDVDSELVGWAQANIDFAEFVVGPHEPPLPYPDAHFDVVINHSVFTHIDRVRQDMWLTELQRVTAPGGVLLLTVHSAREWNQALVDMDAGGEDTDTYRRELEETGLIFFAEDSFIGTTHPDWYHTTFHAPWYIFEHWSEFFKVRAYLPEGSLTQDLVGLERMGAPDPMLRPIGHGSADTAASGPSVAAGRALARSPHASSGPSLAAGEALARARQLHDESDARQSAWGRVRERALRGELARADAVDERLIAAVEALAADGAAGGRLDAIEHELQGFRRMTMVLRSALDDQAAREAHVAAELRAEIAELRARLMARSRRG